MSISHMEKSFCTIGSVPAPDNLGNECELAAPLHLEVLVKNVVYMISEATKY